MKLYKAIAFLARGILRIFFRIEIEGKEYALEENGLICSNHVSNWDPVFISAFYPYPIYWMAKEELFHNPLLRRLLTRLGAFPVDREKNDLSALKKALRLSKKGCNVGIFPEGTRVKERDPSLVKSGVGLLAMKTKGKVSPVSIRGNYRIFSKIKLVIQPPLEPQDLAPQGTKGQEAYQEVSIKIMDKIYGEG